MTQKNVLVSSVDLSVSGAGTIATQCESAAEERAASIFAVNEAAEPQSKVGNNNASHCRTRFHGDLNYSFPRIMSHFVKQQRQQRWNWILLYVKLRPLLVGVSVKRIVSLVDTRSTNAGPWNPWNFSAKGALATSRGE